VNGAIDAFVRAATIELPRGLRINAVSPGVLLESMPVYGEYFRGHEPVPGERVANAYVKSLEGRLTGQRSSACFSLVGPVAGVHAVTSAVRRPLGAAPRRRRPMNMTMIAAPRHIVPEIMNASV
jgi:NAD(P)-dependent dehydrogenase (short-subunit alcohol dehydrogenase family)